MTGKIILAFCRNNKDVLTMESTDDGLTWGNMVDITETVVLPAWGFIGTGPPGGIQLPSGRLIICMTTYYVVLLLEWHHGYQNSSEPK